MAALLGALPIAIGHGSGAEARQPLGLCVIGGLPFSQVVTLYLTPAVYLLLSRASVLAPVAEEGLALAGWNSAESDGVRDISVEFQAAAEHDSQ